MEVNTIALGELSGRIYDQQRGLLRLVDTETLAALAIRQRVEQVRLGAAAEAAARLWLYGGCPPGKGFEREQSDCLNALRGYAGDSATDIVLEWAQSQKNNRAFALNHPSLHEVFRTELNNLLAKWKEADGVVIFIRPKDVRHNLPLAGYTVLPFTLCSDGDIGAYTVDGVALGQLDQGVKDALALARDENWKGISPVKQVVFCTLEGECSNWLGGESLGLPVVLALAKKARKLPVSPIDRVASGVLQGKTLPGMDPNDYLRKMRVLLRMNPQRILLPDFASKEDLDQRVHCLPATGVGAAVYNSLNGIEPRSGPELMAKLDTIGTDLQYARRPYAEIQRELEDILGELSQKETKTSADNITQALAKLHLGAVYCHMGRPAEACKLIDEVKDSAFLDDQEKALAFIRLGVIQTDLCCFDDAEQAFIAAERCIHAGRKQNDLNMRLNGSRSQALLYHALLVEEPKRGTMLNQATSCLQHAFELAEEEKDRAQDLYYLFLAKALHQPDTLTESYRQEVRDGCANPSSFPYFVRAQWLASYRAWLLGCALPPDPEDAIPDGLEDGEWIRATTLKYRGTVWAARGKYAEAVQDFQEALMLLERASGLTGFFRVTIALQAADSLQEHDSTIAVRYLEQVRSLFAEHPEYDNLLFGPVRGCNWRRRAEMLLQGEQDGIPHPQLHYCY